MKRIIVGALVLLCGNALAVDIEAVRERDRGYMEAQRQHGGESFLLYQHNSHVLRDGYLPRDLAEQGGVAFDCTESGQRVTGGSTGFCRDFRSAQGKTSWRIRFSRQYQGSAEHVFKVSNGKPVLWTQFNPNDQQIVYVSPGAQTYAATHGGGMQTAQSPAGREVGIASNSCTSLSGNARAVCEGIGGALPALGGILGR